MLARAHAGWQGLFVWVGFVALAATLDDVRVLLCAGCFHVIL